MAKTSDLTLQAIEGYQAVEEHGAKAPCPYLFSSAHWLAWQVGKWLRDTGRSTPRGVRMSRGFRLHANDMLVQWTQNPDMEMFTRVN